MTRHIKASTLFCLVVFADYPQQALGRRVLAWQVLLAGILRAEQEGAFTSCKGCAMRKD